MAALKKEKIKDQMVKTAARLWEIPENEIEANFDPLVLLLIEACSAELEKIGHKIRESHQRLVDRLAELLVPDSATGAYPASCVIQAQPGEENDIVTPKTPFVINNEQGNAAVANKLPAVIDMVPVGKFLLHDVQLKYFAAGNTLYKTNATGTRELLFSNENRGASNTILLMLSPGKSITSLKHLQFYFNLRNISDGQQFYFSLAHTTCKVNGTPVALKQGYSTQDQFDLQPADMLSKGHHYHEKIKRNIAANYANRFIHLTDEVDSTPGTIPSTLSWLPAELTKLLNAEPLIYVELTLPRPFSQDLFDALNSHINAFPVVNLKSNQIQYRTTEWINIIPLPIQGHFVDLTDVSSSSGHPYHFRYAAGKKQPDEGEAILRNAGVGNTSSHEIRGMTANLMESIRDQYAFFSEISNQTILNQLKDITILLNRLEDKLLESKDQVENRFYLLLRPIEPSELISVDYYTTFGSTIHAIKLYSALQALKHGATKQGSCFTITPLVGGRESPGMQEKQLILKQQLLSRGKIVTGEDIRLVCRQLFGNNLSKVDIGRSTQIQSGSKQGFALCVTVNLTLTKDHHLSADEINYQCRQLEYELAEGAIPGLPFEIKVVA